VVLLLRLGADPRAAADAGGTPPLHRAAARGHAAVMRLLLAAGADPWQRVSPRCTEDGAPHGEDGQPARSKGGGGGGGGRAAGQTPLMLAAQFGHLEALHLLLARLRWADTDALDKGLHGSGGGGGSSDAGSSGSSGGASGPEQAAPDGGGGGASLAAHLTLCDAAGLSALHLAAQWGMAEAAEALLAARAGESVWFALLYRCWKGPCGVVGAMSTAGLAGTSCQHSVAPTCH
jgi:ankyrin repeat protein